MPSRRAADLRRCAVEVDCDGSGRREGDGSPHLHAVPPRVDVLAGLTVAAIAAALGYRLARGTRSPKYVAAAVHGRTTVQTGA